MAKKRTKRAPDPQKQQQRNRSPGERDPDDEAGGGNEGELISEMSSDRAILARLHDYIRSSYQGFEQQRNAYVDNAKMLSNDQWPDEAKEERAADQRPTLVFNKTTKNILTLAGVQSQTGTEPHLLPFEPGDIVPTEVMSLLVRNIRERTDARTADRDVFIGKIGKNLDYWKVWMDYARRPQGDFRIDWRSSLQVYTDPNWIMQRDWSASRYAIEQFWLPVDQAMEEWRDEADRIRHRTGEWQQGVMTGLNLGLRAETMGDTLESYRMFWDKESQRVAIFEAWWKETIRTEIVMFLDTEQVVDDPKEVKRIKEETKGIPKKELAEKLVFIRRPVTVVKTAHFLGDILLGDVIDSPYADPELPYFPACGYLFWNCPISLTDIMKDPQREKNKRRTSLIEMMGRMPLSGFFNHATQGIPDKQQAMDVMTGHGLLVDYTGVKPEPIPAPEIPQAVVLLEQMADREIDSTVNVNAELLGQTTQTTVSGKAIEARQRGGLLTHEVLFTTFREDVARYTKFLIKLVQQFMTPAEALRILGSYALREPNNEQIQALGELDDLGILEALDRAFSIEYDVVIGTKSYDPTHKMAEGQFLAELRSQGVPIPDDILLETLGENGSLSKSTAQKIIARLQQAAQQVAGAAGAPSPGTPATPPQQAAA